MHAFWSIRIQIKLGNLIKVQSCDEYPALQRSLKWDNRLIWWIETDVGVKMVLRGWLTSVGSQSRTTPAAGSGSQGRGGLCSCSLSNAWESPTPESARHTGHTGISRTRCDILETAVLKSITRWQKENVSEQVSAEACLFPLTTCLMHQLFLAYAKVKRDIEIVMQPKYKDWV